MNNIYEPGDKIKPNPRGSLRHITPVVGGATVSISPTIVQFTGAGLEFLGYQLAHPNNWLPYK